MDSPMFSSLSRRLLAAVKCDPYDYEVKNLEELGYIRCYIKFAVFEKCKLLNYYLNVGYRVIGMASDKVLKLCNAQKFNIIFRHYSGNLRTFQDDFHNNHIQTNTFQKSLLAVGSAVVSILNPRRADMIACLGETTGESAAKFMLKKMQQSEEGIKILEQRPRINSRTVDLKFLSTLPENTLGKTYHNFLVKNKVTPDSRMCVQYVDNIELAYVMQRYRETHDLNHTVLQMPTNMLGEVTVKWVEAIQTRLPMCIGGAIFGPIRLKPKHRYLYSNHYLPWAIETGSKADFLLNIHFEKRWEQPLDEFYREVNIVPLVIKKQ